MHRLTTLVTAALALLLAASPAAAQRRIDSPPPVWTHQPTGMAFPDRVGDFNRTSIILYGEDDRDASAGYTLNRGGAGLAIVTIYIYPAWSNSCDEMFEDAQKAITQSHPAAKLLSDGRAPSPTGRTADGARRARYAFDVDLGDGQQPVNSELYVYCPPGSAWVTKYRATWPIANPVERDIETLYRSFDWPAPFSR